MSGIARSTKSLKALGAIGTVAGVIVLSACSGGADQAQTSNEASREAAPKPSASPTGESPTGQPPQTPVVVGKGFTALPKPDSMPKAGSGRAYFGDVTVSTTKGVKCQQKTTDSELIVTCPKLAKSGNTSDKVMVHFPDKTYKVTIESMDSYYPVSSWLRDYIDAPYKQQVINYTGSWSGKDIWTGGWGWSATAAPMGDKTVSVKLTIIRQFD